MSYYVYSAALGGAKLMEVDANGDKAKGYVYGGGMLIAKQEVYQSTNSSSVKWQHHNPGSGSWVETQSNRAYERQEMDPLGQETGAVDPFLINPNSNYSDIHGDTPMFVDGGDPFHLSDGCGDIDGMPASCEEISDRMENGSAIPASLEAAQRRPGFSFESLGLGMYRYYVPDAGTLSDQIVGNNEVNDEGEVTRTNSDVPRGRWGFIALRQPVFPQLAAIRRWIPQPQKSEEEQAAETVATGVEAALQVLDKGCWDPSTWNRNVKPHDRYFATVENADKFTKDWSGSLSVHAKDVKESPAIAGVYEDPMGLWNFDFVIKSYPGQGMAVTADSLSLPHAAAVPGYVAGVDENVNVRWAQWLLKARGYAVGMSE